jgi:fluoroacetyl-CoA thioesterase
MHFQHFIGDLDDEERRAILASNGRFAMKSIAVGATGSWALDVRSEHLANGVKDAALPAVLATPVLVAIVENAAFAAIRNSLDSDETAVGTHIDIRHLSPTPAGVRVVGQARVTAVEGRRIVFQVRAADEYGQIGVGTHERVVVPLSRIEAAVEARRRGRTHLRSQLGDIA